MARKLSALALGGCLLLTALPAFAGDRDHGKNKSKHKGAHSGPGHSYGSYSASGVPPGLAKKGGLPPGLAKRLGRPVPARLYVAFDPRRDDRAWFLIDDRWVLFRGFDPGLRLEVRNALSLPHVPLPPLRPPVPRLHVVLFG